MAIAAPTRGASAVLQAKMFCGGIASYGLSFTCFESNLSETHGSTACMVYSMNISSACMHPARQGLV